jgi:hypothetical protein
MKTTRVRAQPAAVSTGAKLERSLRKRGFQTDQLTLSISRNLKALERFAGHYQLHTLLTSRARGMFAAMSCEECGHFIEFLQRSIHVGRKSMRTREGWIHAREAQQNLAYLAAVAGKPQFVEGRARAIFRSLSPEAQKMTAMMLLAAWQVTRQAPGLKDDRFRAGIVDRMVEQLAGDTGG